MNGPFHGGTRQQGSLPQMGRQMVDSPLGYGITRGIPSISSQMPQQSKGVSGNQGLPSMSRQMGGFADNSGIGHGLPSMGQPPGWRGGTSDLPSVKNQLSPQPQRGNQSFSLMQKHNQTSQLMDNQSLKPLNEHRQPASSSYNRLPSTSPPRNQSGGLPAADNHANSPQPLYSGYANRRASRLATGQEVHSSSHGDGKLLTPHSQYGVQQTDGHHGSASPIGQNARGDRFGQSERRGSRFGQHSLSEKQSSGLPLSLTPPPHQGNQPNSRAPLSNYARHLSHASNNDSHPPSGSETTHPERNVGHQPSLTVKNHVVYSAYDNQAALQASASYSNNEQNVGHSNSRPPSVTHSSGQSSPASRSRPPSAGHRPSSASKTNGLSPASNKPPSRPSSAKHAREQCSSVDKRRSSSLERSTSLNRSDKLRKPPVSKSLVNQSTKSSVLKGDQTNVESSVSESSSSTVEEHLIFPKNFVMEVEGSLAVGSKIVINECATTVDDDVDASQDEVPNTQISYNKEEFQTTKPSMQNLSCHEQAHHNADMRLNARKWPWERNGNQNNDEMDAEEAALFSNKELYRKFKPKRRRPVNQSLQLQKFVYQDGFIVCQHSQGLVLGMEESEGRSAEVVLVKRRPDDISQRWTIKENGIIQSKHNPQLVMTVSLPTPDAREEFGLLADMTYIGCQVILKNKKVTQFGRANQRWYYDEGSGFVGAFHTDNIDKEITAAIKANVCTFAVMGRTEIDQPGYSVEMPVEKGRKTRKVTVCSSCARAMRGRFKLERVQGQVDFACAMGFAKELQVKQIGSFKCLNGKVDLSTNEAEHTLEEWELQLERLRDELSVRAIAKEIAAARVPYTVKVLAHRNGDGHTKSGELIVGSSIPGILEQCASRLGLTSAGRAMFTADGTQVIDLDELVEWMREQYVERARDDLRAKALAKRAAKTGDAAKESLISKVDPEEWTDEDEDEDESVEQDDGEVNLDEMVHYGFDASTSRSVSDTYLRESYTEILPSSMMMTSPGKVVVWRVYVPSAGQPLYMQIYRQSEDDPRSFQLVGETEIVPPQPGYYVVDVTNKLAQQVTPEGLAAGDSISIKIKGSMMVRKDDVLGFHQPANAHMIPFDEEAQNEPALALHGKPHVQPGQLISFPGDLPVQRERQYSFNASVAPVVPGRTPSPVNKKGNKKKKKSKGPHIDPPPVEMVLRYPIEVWVTCGEQFVRPQKVERQHEQTIAQREARAAVAYELDKEKHVLRQMQGRRLDELNPGKYQSTMNPASPVLIEGHWQDPSLDEQVKHDTVHKLQTHLTEVKSTQKPKVTKTLVDPTRPLYTQPVMKRVLVFPNGESITRAVYVWGENMAQLMDNSTTRLNLRKQPMYMFDMNGEILSDIADVERDQLVCVASSKAFLRPKESNHSVEVKANWGRARKQYGPQATDIVVKANPNPAVDVDAFGPSEIAGYLPY